MENTISKNTKVYDICSALGMTANKEQTIAAYSRMLHYVPENYIAKQLLRGGSK